MKPPSLKFKVVYLDFIKMIWRPATWIELKQEEDMIEYEEFIKEK